MEEREQWVLSILLVLPSVVNILLPVFSSPPFPISWTCLLVDLSSCARAELSGALAS